MSSSRSSSTQALFNRRAEVCLRFIIVGAGLAGLGVAYNLRKAGHSVQILEKDDGVGKVSLGSSRRRFLRALLTHSIYLRIRKGIGGVRVPPNMSQLLVRWGLGPKLKKLGGVCKGITFHDGE
jgi:salicylate hydroxylase